MGASLHVHKLSLKGFFVYSFVILCLKCSIPFAIRFSDFPCLEVCIWFLFCHFLIFFLVIVKPFYDFLFASLCMVSLTCGQYLHRYRRLIQAPEVGRSKCLWLIKVTELYCTAFNMCNSIGMISNRKFLISIHSTHSSHNKMASMNIHK